MSSSEDIKEKIKGKGYWLVVIRPNKTFYKKDRFNIQELSKVIESNQIRLRGWYYPHISRESVEISAEDKIRNTCDFEGLIEYWEFTTSGQFGHIFSMREDYIFDKEQADKIRSSFLFEKDKAKDIDKFFEVVSAVYRFTEIYKLASNLAQIKEYEDVESFDILIELYGVKDRMLHISGFFRELWSPYICRIDKDIISFSETYKTDDLIAQFDSLALEKAIKTFQLFGWKNPSPQVFKEDQKKLLERRF